MLVIGTDSIPTQTDTGSFRCPSCLRASCYTVQKVRSFLTLFFVPIFPIKEEGSYVECRFCRSTFETNVLQPKGPSSLFSPIFKKTIIKMLGLMAHIDGYVHLKEREEISQLSEELLGESIPEEELNLLLSHIDINKDYSGILNFIRSARPMLNTSGREKVFIAACRIAVADKIIHPGEKTLLKNIGDNLGLSPKTKQEIMSEYLRQNTIYMSPMR